MSWTHVLESATGTGIAMVLYTWSRQLAARVALAIVMRRIGGGHKAQPKAR